VIPSCHITKYLRLTHKRRKGLFYLTVLEVLVNDWPHFFGLEARQHVMVRECGRENHSLYQPSGSQWERESNQDPTVLFQGTPPVT
jgi:hypothetical protein